MELAMKPILKTFLIVFVCLICLSNSVQAQTAFELSPGDIGVIGYNTNNNKFAIVCFREIPIGTKIRFTDNGWLYTGSFRTGEGVIYWNTSEICELGEIVTIDYASLSYTGTFNLSDSGDQIFVYQELTQNNPKFVFGLNTYDNTWQTNASGATTSALPADLANASPVPALAIKHLKYSTYTETYQFDSVDDAKILTTDPNNWTETSSAVDLPSGFFSFETTAVHLSEFGASSGSESPPVWVLLGLVIAPAAILLFKRPKRDCCSELMADRCQLSAVSCESSTIFFYHPN